MSCSGISVKVLQNNENIYEETCEYSDINDLNNVTLNIRKMQKKINEFLTQLIEQNVSTGNKSHTVVSDDTDSNTTTDEDVELEAKK
ncbi:PREDICTED: uncharacterized protein LOC107071436 isoform X2 [Polistes dominula]|uniref:Uncharacterized protein LOC107071436 isoform X2 n=1 Tax=Polistes dominula TaxID=743375 RepID=A0ABM1J0D8_POLDO|nr:PREDICTED: uncharacterized protein LOC107071436 isoform X2 [Polistes dominula]